MRSSVPVRRATAGWSDEKRNGRTATGSPTAAVDLLPVTIQQAQTLSSRNRRKPGWLVRFFRALPSASSDTDRFSITGKRMRQRGNASRFLASVANGGMLWVMLGIGGVITIYLILSGRFLQAQSAAGVFYWQLSKPHTVTFLAHRQRQRKEMYLPPPMGYDLQDQGKNIPDLGGLLLFVFEEEGQTRQIYHDFSQDEGQVYEIPSEGADDLHDYYYAFDDDALRNPLIAYDDENIQDEKQCRRVSWHRDTLLNCNSFHELGLAYNNLDSLEMKGAGTYRQVFATEQPVLDKQETVIFKEYIYTADYIYSDFEFMRMDAVVSEIFTSSPLFVDIYGYCGLSMLSEYLELGDLEAHATPDGPRDEEVVLHDEEDLDPQNSFNARDKLFISLEMAEALALLHSYPGGVIVHDDVQLAQFLPTKEGHLKMNDFNRAEIMLFNEEDQEYCRYKNNPGNGDWRAPEEYVDAPLNEKIDVWSLGNNMYAVLTGLNPYYKELHQSEVKRLVRHGEKPFVDPRWRTRSHAERALVETMELCWEFNADDRIDVFEVVKRLQHALEVEYQQDAKNGVESPAATVEYRATKNCTGTVPYGDRPRLAHFSLDLFCLLPPTQNNDMTMSSPSALPTATTTPSTYLQPHTVSMNASTSEVLVTKRQRLLSNENDLSAATSGDNVFAATIPPQPQAKTAVNGKEPSAWPTMAPPVSRDPLATSTTKTTTPTTTTPTTATTVAVQKRSTRTIKRELARLSDVSFAGTLKAVHSKRRGALTISTPVVTDSRRLRSAFNVPVVDEGGLKSRGSSNIKKQHVAMKNTSTLAPGAGRARSSVATPKKQGKATKRRIAVDPALHGSTLVATKKAAVGLVTATAAATVGTSMVPSITPSSTKSAFLSEEAVKTVPLKTAVAGQEAVGSGLIEAGGSETVVKLGLLGNGFYFVINGNKATTSSTFDYPATEGGGIQSGLAVLPVSLNNVSNVAEPKQIKAVGSSVPYTKDSAPMKENPKSLNSSAALNDSLNGSIQARKFKVAPADSSGKNEADLQHNPTKLKTGAPVITVTTAAIFKAPLPPKMDCMFQPIVPKENKVATVELTATDHTVALRLAAAATATTTPTTLAASVTPDPILDFRSPLVHHTIISEQEMATFIQETLMSTARDDGVLGDGAAACQEPSVKHEHMPDLWGTPERVLIDRQTTNGGAHGDVLFSGRLDTMSWEGGSPAGGDFDVDEFLSKGGTAEVG